MLFRERYIKYVRTLFKNKLCWTRQWRIVLSLPFLRHTPPKSSKINLFNGNIKKNNSSVILSIYILFCVLDLQRSSIVEFIIIYNNVFYFRFLYFPRINHKIILQNQKWSSFHRICWLVFYCYYYRWKIGNRAIELIQHVDFFAIELKKDMIFNEKHVQQIYTNIHFPTRSNGSFIIINESVIVKNKPFGDFDFHREKNDFCLERVFLHRIDSEM